MVPFLKMIGLPESIVDLLRDSSSGYALTAYAMYKVTSSREEKSANQHTVKLPRLQKSFDQKVVSSVCVHFRSSGHQWIQPVFVLFVSSQIATPARYTVTLGGTSLSLQYLRKHGYLSTPPPVKEYFQDKMEETKEKLTEKMEETKERFSEKMEETKERLSEKMEETKDKLSEKLQETKDRVSERKTFFRKKND